MRSRTCVGRLALQPICCLLECAAPHAAQSAFPLYPYALLFGLSLSRRNLVRFTYWLWRRALPEQLQVWEWRIQGMKEGPKKRAGGRPGREQNDGRSGDTATEGHKMPALLTGATVYNCTQLGT